MNSSLALSILIVTTVLFTAASAQWPADTVSSLRICNATGDQQFPEMAGDGAGGAIVAWQDGRAEKTAIYAQRVDSSGVVQWAANGVPVCSTMNAQLPKAVSDGAGGAIIVWFDWRSESSNGGVFAQRVGPDGSMLWTRNGVALSEVSSQWAYPVVAGYGAEGAVVAWVGQNGEVYAQKIDTAGRLLWSPGASRISEGGEQPRICGDDSGGAYITWYRYDSEHISTDIFGARVRSNGVVSGFSWADTLCKVDGYQQRPVVAPDGAGGAIFAWLDSRDADSTFIYAQNAIHTGVLAWTHNGVRAGLRNATAPLRIASGRPGSAYLAWVDYTPSDIYVGCIGLPQGEAWSGDLRLTVNAMPQYPMIIPDGAYGAFVFWEVPGNPARMKVQHLSPSGGLSFEAEGRTLAHGANMSGYMAGITDNRGLLIVAWEDLSSAYTADIYMKSLTVPGFSTGIRETRPAGSPLPSVELDVSPNPLGASAALTYRLARNGRVSLKIYDATGRLAVSLVDGPQSAGVPHRVVLDASRLACGVYVCELRSGREVRIRNLLVVK